MIHLMTENGIACGRASKYANTWDYIDDFIERSKDKITSYHLCKKCLSKIKVSSHEPNQQGANSGQLQQHNVGGRSELLLAFLQHLEDYGPWEFRDKTGTVQQFLEGKQ